MFEIKKVAFSRFGFAGPWPILFVSIDGDTGRTIDPGTMQILHSFARD